MFCNWMAGSNSLHKMEKKTAVKLTSRVEDFQICCRCVEEPSRAEATGRLDLFFSNLLKVSIFSSGEYICFMIREK